MMPMATVASALCVGRPGAADSVPLKAEVDEAMANGSIPMSFFVHLTAHETGTAIRVVRADHPYGDLLYPMMQNEFWQQLADAEPVPYDGGIP